MADASPVPAVEPEVIPPVKPDAVLMSTKAWLYVGIALGGYLLQRETVPAGTWEWFRFIVGGIVVMLTTLKTFFSDSRNG